MATAVIDRLREGIAGSVIGRGDFASADDQGRVRENYGANDDRLVTVRRAYDPVNVFPNNQNIAP